MESKGKGFSLFAKTTIKVADAAVVISFPCQVSSFVLGKLRSGACGDVKLTTHMDDTAIAYAVYQLSEINLKGTPMALIGSRVSQMSCGAQGSDFNISLNTHGSLTYVRKCIRLVLKSMALDKLYSLYERNMKSLGCKPDRGVFNKCANAIQSKINGGTKISIIGKVNLNKKAAGKAIPVQKTLDALTKKLELPTVSKLGPEASRQAADMSAEPDCGFPEIKCSGLDALLLASYIASTVRYPTSFSKSSLIVHSQSWTSQKAKLKESARIKAFITKKYTHARLDDHLSSLFAYQASTTGAVSSSSVKQIARSSLKSADLESRLKGVI